MNIQFKPSKSAVYLGIAIGFFTLFLIALSFFIIKGINKESTWFDSTSDYVLLAIPLFIQLLGGCVAVYFYFSSKKQEKSSQ